MSTEYPYEVRDPQVSEEWTPVHDTWNAWASVLAFLNLKSYDPRQFVDAPHVFQVRHPRTDPGAIHQVRVSVPLRIATHVCHAGFTEWHRVGTRGEVERLEAEVERLESSERDLVRKAGEVAARDAAEIGRLTAEVREERAIAKARMKIIEEQAATIERLKTALADAVDKAS